jgi:DNA-binding LytR/AlgR family response regulator
MEVATTRVNESNELLIVNTQTDANDQLKLTEEELSSYGFFKTGGELNKFYFSELKYLKSDHLYVKVFTKDKNFLLRAKLSDAEFFLPSDKFQRIHQRYIINIDYITKITVDDVWINELELPLSKQYKAALIKRLRVFP